MHMNEQPPKNDYSNQVVVITGGAGVLCSPIGKLLASHGANIVILDINQAAITALAKEINQNIGKAVALQVDVTKREDLESSLSHIMQIFGQINILINGAGGNHPRATTSVENPFFDLPLDAIQWVVNLNMLGTILPCQVFGKVMAQQKAGIILNISSMNAIRPLSRIPAYSAAKAAVSNFTQWLSVYMAQEYSPAIRVNAIAPGFFLTDQNQYLLIDRGTGDLSERGQAIINHTPMRRFGNPEDILGTVLWLISPASSFITGIVVPIDGGFSSYSGV